MCAKCEENFDVEKTPGALVISPSESFYFKYNLSKQIHICPKCWEKLKDFIFDK